MADPVIINEPRGGNTALAVAAVGAAGLAVWFWRRGRETLSERDRALAALATRGVSEPQPRTDKAPLSTPSPPRYVGPSEPISRTFDPVFAREGQGIPVAYLRALAAHESDLKLDLAKGPAWGLLQVVEVVRRDYNQRHGTSYERRDLLDATINVRIAADMLAFIAENYRKHHAAPNLIEDWQNPRFVELLTYGWNAGYSERAGVGRVARYLENTDTPVTIATVHAAARAVGASPHLSEPIKVIYARAVTATYLRERDRDAREGYGVAPSGASIRIAPALSTPAAPAAPMHTASPPAPPEHLIATAPAPAPTSPRAPHEIEMPPMIIETHHVASDAMAATNAGGGAATAHEAQHGAPQVASNDSAAPATTPH